MTTKDDTTEVTSSPTEKVTAIGESVTTEAAETAAEKDAGAPVVAAATASVARSPHWQNCFARHWAHHRL